MASNLSRFTRDQWTELIPYLDPGDLRDLRLAGGRATGLADPRLTCHLPLRLDRAPFFRDDAVPCPEEYARRWLEHRRRVVLDGADVKLSAGRVARLVKRGFLDAVTELVVYDCHRHEKVIEALSTLPHLDSLTLVDHGDEGEAPAALEAIVRHVGRMRRLATLDVEFDAVLPGRRLAFLRGLRGLRRLRLVGFDLSAGLGALRGLTGLDALHLCHGNLYSSPPKDASEADLRDLTGLAAVRTLHLEGFDEFAGAGLGPFGAGRALRDLTLRHCQDLSQDCLAVVGRMVHLHSLHFVASACDDVEVFDCESLRQLNTLSALKSLSLFYLLDAPADLRVLPGLTSLEALNLAFDAMLTREEMEEVCTHALRTFPSLQRLRIFSEDGMEYGFKYGRLAVEAASFSFGDAVYLD